MFIPSFGIYVRNVVNSLPSVPWSNLNITKKIITKWRITTNTTWSMRFNCVNMLPRLLLYLCIIVCALVNYSYSKNNNCYDEHLIQNYLVDGHWIPAEPLNRYGNLKCPLEMLGKTPTGNFTCILNYQWEATTCQSSSFDAVTFLQRLQSKLVLLSGDSVTKQSYVSLVCHLFEHANPDLNNQNIPWARPVRKEGNEYLFTHHHHITFLDDLCFHFDYNVTICCCLEPYHYKTNADLVLWNGRGLHYHIINSSRISTDQDLNMGDSEDRTPIAYRDVLKRIGEFAKSHPSKLIVYRETSAQSFPGTANGDYDNRDPHWIVHTADRCMPAFDPPAAPPESPNRAWTHLETWRQQLEQEIILREYGLPYLKAYDTQFGLPCEGSGHFINECTHFHMPGVPDAWMTMLYNFVLHSPLVSAWHSGNNTT